MVKGRERYLLGACLAHSCSPKPKKQPTLKRKRPNWTSALVVVISALVSMASQVSTVSTVSALEQDRFSRRRLFNVFEPPEDIDQIIESRQGSLEDTNAPTDTPESSTNQQSVSDTPRPAMTNDNEDTPNCRPNCVEIPSFPTESLYFVAISFHPTESPAPSPSPSKDPTSTPTASMSPSGAPTFSPTDTLGPSPSPSESPTVSPSLLLTPQPTERPTQAPTATPISVAPSPRPSLRPSPRPSPRPVTNDPTFIPTISRQPSNSPTRKPTRSPSATPTKQPTVSSSLSPSIPSLSQLPTADIIIGPSKIPSPNPSLLPSFSPSLLTATSTIPTTRILTPGPTTSPTLGPKTNQTTNAPSWSIEPSMRELIPPTIPVTDIPLAPFEVRLAFDEPLSTTDKEKAPSELQVAMTKYLMRELGNEDFGDGVELGSFDFTVSSASNSPTRRRKKRFLRGLQQSAGQVYTYNVDGTADFSTEEGVELDTTVLARSVDSSVNEVFENPEGSEAFTEYLQTGTDSEVVQTTAGAFVETKELLPENPGGKSKPTTLAIVIGFILVALAVLSLLFYAYVWWKGYKKRAAQKRRERQGVHAMPKPVTNSARTSQSPQQRQIQQQQQQVPPVAPGFLASSNVTSPPDDSSSDDDSSYQGVDSEDSGDNDAFSRELKLAASLDKRDWEDYQRKRQQMTDEGMIVGDAPEMSNSRDGDFAGVAAGTVAGVAVYGAIDDHHDEDEGYEITDAGSTLVIGTAGSSEDYQSAISRTTFPYGDEGDSSRADPPAPRGSTVVHRSPRSLNDPSGVRGSQLAIVSPDAEDYSEGIELNAAGVAQNPRVETIDEDSMEDSDFDPATMLMNSLTDNTGSFRARNPVPRSSPSQSIAASIPSSQAVQLSQTSISSNPRASRIGASAVAVAKEMTSKDDDDTEDHQYSKDSTSLQSLLTIDIVKEVQKLSQFVKKYEKKREKEKMKEVEREERAIISRADSRSVPSVSYDALSEGGRFNVPGDTEDDASESESSQSSWSSGDDSLHKSVARNRSSAPKLPIQVNPDEGNNDSSVDSEKSLSADGSDDSRLGITPFSVQKLMASKPDVEASRRRIAERQAAKAEPSTPVSKALSKPPVTGHRFSATVLSPIPGTPESPAGEYYSSSGRDDIPRNVKPNRSPGSKRSPRKLPSGQTSPLHAEPMRSAESNLSPRKSSSGQRSPLYNTGNNRRDGIHDSLRGNLGASGMKETSGRKKQRLSYLRQNDSIADADSEIMTALSPSSEDGKHARGMAPSDEETIRGGSQRGADTTSPGFKATPRKSLNKGFNNILSMFEAKPSRNAVFPPNENWQYNY